MQYPRKNPKSSDTIKELSELNVYFAGICQQIVRNMQETVFNGGTSLSKNHKIAGNLSLIEPKIYKKQKIGQFIFFNADSLFIGLALSRLVRAPADLI